MKILYGLIALVMVSLVILGARPSSAAEPTISNVYQPQPGQIQVSSQPMAFWDGGKWQPINTDLANLQSWYTLTIDGYSVLIEHRYTMDSIRLTLNTLADSVLPIISDNTATWLDAETDTDIRIVARRTGIAFQRILKGEKANLSATFIIEENNPNRSLQLVSAAYDTDGEKLAITSIRTDTALTETVTATGKWPIVVDPTISLSVNQSSDDIAVWEAAGSWTSNLTQINQTSGWTAGSTFKYGGGMRWVGLSIPTLSTINNAYVTFRASSSTSGVTVNSVFTGELTGAANTFSTLADYQARRGTIVGGADDSNITTAQVTWNAIAAWTANTNYQSPALTTIIQELADSFNLTEVALFWDDHAGSSSASAGANRNGYSWDATADAPILFVDWTEPATTPTPTPTPTPSATPIPTATPTPLPENPWGGPTTPTPDFLVWFLLAASLVFLIFGVWSRAFIFCWFATGCIIIATIITGSWPLGILSVGSGAFTFYATVSKLGEEGE